MACTTTYKMDGCQHEDPHLCAIMDPFRAEWSYHKFAFDVLPTTITVHSGLQTRLGELSHSIRVKTTLSELLQPELVRQFDV